MSTFNHNPKFSRNLATESMNLQQFRMYLKLVFGTEKEAAQQARMSHGRLRQFFCGYHIPKSPTKIMALSNAWGINIVLLTRILEDLSKNSPIVVDRHKNEASEVVTANDEGTLLAEKPEGAS